MASFFSKKQYTAIADEELTIKLLNERCSGMFDLYNILQFIIDSFNQGSSSEQNFISYTHQ